MLKEILSIKYKLWQIIVIIFITLFIIEIITERKPEVEAEVRQSTVLENIWEKRLDLQLVFPDGENGINEMEGWIFTQWAEEFGWRENYFLMQYQPGLEMEKAVIYEKYLPIERALIDIRTQEYDLKNYNCVDFSQDLQKKLKEKGITSVLLEGNTQYVGHNYHCWLAIQFEPIEGDIVSNLDNYKPVKIYK